MAGTYAPHDEVYTQRHTLATLQRNPHLLESTSSAGGTVCDLFTFQATCMSCSHQYAYFHSLTCTKQKHTFVKCIKFSPTTQDLTNTLHYKYTILRNYM